MWAAVFSLALGYPPDNYQVASPPTSLKSPALRYGCVGMQRIFKAITAYTLWFLQHVWGSLDPDSIL